MPRNKSWWHKFSGVLIAAGVIYLLIGVVLFLLFAPFRTEVLKMRLSLSSLEKPVRVSLALLVLGLLFRFIGEKQSLPGLTANQFCSALINSLSERIKPYRRFLKLFPFLLLAVLMIYFIGYKVLQHFTYDTGAYDLSVIDHALYHTIHGAFLQGYAIDRNYFSEHFSPILLIFLPGYYLWPSSIILLVTQGVAAGLTVWALYGVGCQRGLPRGVAALSSLIFAFHPKFWEGFRFDFHQEMLFPPLLFLAAYFLFKRRLPLFCFFCFTALLVKEDVSLYFIVLGLYVAVRYSAKWGAVLAATSCLWAVVVFYLIIPHSYPEARQVSHFVERYHHYGSSYLGIVKGLIAAGPELFPEIIAAAFRYLLKPLLYLPLLSPSYFVMGLFPLVLHVSSNFDYQASLGAYYAVMGLSFFMLGFINVLSWLFRRSSFGICVGVVAVFYLTSGLEIYPWRRILVSDTMVSRFLERLDPEDKIISAGNVLVPHLPRNNRIYVFPRVEDAELILLYLRPGRPNTWPLDPPAYFREIKSLLRNNRFRVSFFNGSALFLERGNRQKDVSRAVLKEVHDLERSYVRQ